MKKLTLIFGIIIFSTTSMHAQELDTDKEAQEAISRLKFIVGDWAGNGWRMGRNGERNMFDQTEKINLKLDGTAILIEGMGKSNGKTIHDALAIISYNKTDSSYNFRSYLSNGLSGDFKAEVIEGKLYWYPRENMRYVIDVNDEGQWNETGEMKRGNDWFQFFSMTLERQ